MAIDINQHFAEEVRKYRKKMDKSQLELAEMAKVDLSTVNRVERGVANITLRSAFKITKALHVPMYKFFLTDDEARKQERKGEITGKPIEE